MEKGSSYPDFQSHGKTENACNFLKSRKVNPTKWEATLNPKVGTGWSWLKSLAKLGPSTTGTHSRGQLGQVGPRTLSPPSEMGGEGLRREENR